MAILLLYICIFMPYFMAFPDSGSNFTQVFFYVIDFTFFIDILLRFNTAFYDKHGTLVSSRKKIAIAYMKFWFWIDLLSIIPIEVILSQFNVKPRSKRIGSYSRILRLLRL